MGGPKVRDSKKFVLDKEIIQPFIPNTYAGGILMLKQLTVGDPTADFKGTDFWVNKLKVYEEKLKNLAVVYTAKLDEKRNFWSFLLTVVSIVQFPIEAITGYYGLNFNNVEEMYKDGVFIPDMYGIEYEWFIIGMTYF